MMKKPDIHTYHNYKDYLRDAIAALKLRKKTTQKNIAEKCNISVSLLSMIISGKRPLSDEVLNSLAYELKLTTSEKKFLYHLKTLTDSNSLTKRKKSIERMSVFKKYQHASDQEITIFSYLSKWYNLALRELVVCKNFVNDIDWIYKKLEFKVSKKKIKESLNFLVESKFLDYESGRGYSQTEKNLVCNQEIHRLGLTEAHKQMYDLAIQSIDKVSRDRRWLIGKTIPVSKSQYEKIVTILNNALEQIDELQKEDAETIDVYQISLSAFPLTTDKDKD